MTAKTGAKPTPAQFEAKLLSLSEMGVGKFGRTNMYQLIADVPVEDIPRLLALVDSKVPGELRERFHEAWIERWAQADAPAAFAYVARGNWRGPGLAIVFENWASQDPAAARKAVEACTSPGKDYIRQALANATLEKDPKGTLDWAMAVAPNDPKEHLVDLYTLARKWSGSDPTAAWKWALSLPDGPAKSHFMSDLAYGAANASPLEIGKEVAKMQPGDDQSFAAANVAASWANTDPRAASEWAAQFPNEEYRGLAMKAIATTWVSKDSAAVRAWIQSLPPGNDQQQAMWGMTEALIRSQPEQVADIAPSLTDPVKRDFAIGKVGGSMFKRDPSAARQWLQGLGVTEEKIQEIKKDSGLVPLGSPD